VSKAYPRSRFLRNRLAQCLDRHLGDVQVFDVVPLTIVFGALQVPLLKRYAVEPAE
jgi:hypothetical protein